MPSDKLYGYSSGLTVASYTYILSFLLDGDDRYVEEISIYDKNMVIIINVKIKDKAVVEWDTIPCYMPYTVIEKNEAESSLDIPEMGIVLQMSCLRPLQLIYCGVVFNEVHVFINSRKVRGENWIS